MLVRVFGAHGVLCFDTGGGVMSGLVSIDVVSNVFRCDEKMLEVVAG